MTLLDLWSETAAKLTQLNTMMWLDINAILAEDHR